MRYGPFETLKKFALAAVVAQIPFELRFTFLGLSNLQWTFILLLLLNIPAFVRNFRRLAGDRLVQPAAIFIALQWFAAFVDSPELRLNAIKASTRFTAGFLLLAIARTADDKKRIHRVWVIACGVAAAYALTAYAGIGTGWLFRTEEFYTGQIQRLSGSFEYPNTAAAYFAMSLPLVWLSPFRSLVRSIVVFLLWCAIVLTLSKGALIAALVVIIAAALFSGSAAAGWRHAGALVGLGTIAYLVLLPLNPYLVERFNGPMVRNPLGAQYETPWNYVRQQPSASDELPLRIRNTGITTWRSAGWRRIAVGSRWWSTETQKFLKVRPLITNLPHDVQPGETVQLATGVQMPAFPGNYVLVVELFGRDLLWFSQTGIAPALVQADIQSGSARFIGVSDLSTLYKRGQIPGTLTASIPRSALWRAAAKMVVEHPLGVGPDNFRLEYGKYLGASHWDKNIYSNNLYLEILAGSGFAGLAAFGLMLFRVAWRPEPDCMAVGIFLIHGLVDVFIMTTPIYFAVWILLGMTGPNSRVVTAPAVAVN